LDMPALIPLVPGAAGPPLFFIAGIHLYQELARAIGPDRRSFGVFLPAEANMFRESSANAGLPRVEELARHYLGAIQAEFPDGPYALAGVSFGGVLAFEMARQLTAQGKTVSFLGLLDTVLSRAIERPARRWAQAQWAYLRDRGIAGLAEKGGRLKHHLVRHLGGGAKAPPPCTDLPRAEAIRRLDAFRGELYAHSERQYDETDHLYSGQAVLFRAIDEKRALVRDPTLGWSSLVPGLEVHEVSGDHLGILRPPHVEALAATMRRYLVPRTVQQAA
jgi:thioesterase domain-containing protein